MKKSAFKTTSREELNSDQNIEIVENNNESNDNTHNLRRNTRSLGKPHKKNKLARNVSFQRSDSHVNEESRDEEMEDKDSQEALPFKKKLVFLSCRVYEKAKEHKITNGTQIAREILEESRKLRMNFDFKNVQRRVYDALNVLTALDMIKKDRNKIEFVRDINEVFGGPQKPDGIQPNVGKSDVRETKINSKLKQLRKQKEMIEANLKQKKQYFDELIIQVAMLKKLVRRNSKTEDEETMMNTPDKEMNDPQCLDHFQSNSKIHLPFLVLDFPKNSNLEILMDEEHTNMILLSNSPCQLYNDNHVLLNSGLIGETEQGNIESLYESEVKPIATQKENFNKNEKENQNRDVIFASEIIDDLKNKINIEVKTPKPKGYIDNISSPFKENLLLSYSKSNNLFRNIDSWGKDFIDEDQNCLWKKPTTKASLLQQFADNRESLFKYDEIRLPAYILNTPNSNFGINDQGEDYGMLSPSIGIKKRIEFGTPLNIQFSQK